MDNFSQSVMIAFLPVNSDWCHIDLPHMTLVYAGLIDDLPPTEYNEMGKKVLDISRGSKPFTLNVLGPDVFGDDEEPVDVLLLEETSDLKSLRAQVDHWNASDHPFSPHVTVGPLGSIEGNIPNRILFDRISLNWGDRGFNCYLSPNDISDTELTSPSY